MDRDGCARRSRTSADLKGSGGYELRKSVCHPLGGLPAPEGQVVQNPGSDCHATEIPMTERRWVHGSVEPVVDPLRTFSAHHVPVAAARGVVPAVHEGDHEGVGLPDRVLDRLPGRSSLLGIPEPTFVVGLDEVQVECLLWNVRISSDPVLLVIRRASGQYQ